MAGNPSPPPIDGAMAQIQRLYRTGSSGHSARHLIIETHQAGAEIPQFAGLGVWGAFFLAATALSLFQSPR